MSEDKKKSMIAVIISIFVIVIGHLIIKSNQTKMKETVMDQIQNDTTIERRPIHNSSLTEFKFDMEDKED